MLEKDIPVIKRFVYKDKYYVYDLYKNEILSLSELQYQQVGILEQCGLKKFKNMNTNLPEYKDVISLIKVGYFSQSKIKKIEHPYSDKVGVLIDRCIQDLVLQVTQDCNFKCRYCLYAGNNDVERTHKNVHMDWKTAKKSIDYLFEHSKDIENISIGFYGGEPLLNFELIKKTVEYANELFCLKHLKYIMTTNGSLISDSILQFLMENDFELTVSLDGPSEIQNRHRKFFHNGEDTFSCVYNNIKKIKDNYPSYFFNNVTLSPVVFDDDDIEAMYNFFSHNNISNEQIFFNKANLNGVDYISANIKNSPVSISEKEQSTVDVDAYKAFKTKIERKITIPSVWQHDGQCVPAVRRLFVTVHGDLFPCEKILENEALSLGNIHKTGVDIEKARYFLNIGKLSEEECKHCWSIHFCEMCVSHCIDIENNCLSNMEKQKYCKQRKRNALKHMKHYIDENHI